MRENLVARTARSVLLGSEVGGRSKRIPAGTEVYVTPRRRGGFIVRLPGTLFSQHVTADALLIP